MATIEVLITVSCWSTAKGGEPKSVIEKGL